MSVLEVEIVNDVPLIGKTRAKDVPIGTVFFGSIAEPSVFLRIYEGVVDLRAPRQTWTFPRSEKGPTIDDFRPALAAKLVVG